LLNADTTAVSTAYGSEISICFSVFLLPTQVMQFLVRWETKIGASVKN